MKWFKKLESDVSIIYNYIDSLGNKIVTSNPTDPVDLRTMSNNIKKVIPKYLNLPRNQNTDI